MPGLKDFMEAMGASWPVALAILIGSVAILVGEAWSLSYLTSLPQFIFGIAFLLAAFSSAILAVTLIVRCAEYVRAIRASRRRSAELAQHTAGLHNLPPAERAILGYAAACRTQVFLAPMNHNLVEPLIAKRYVQIVPGMHSILDWPHKIPDHIWTELVQMVPEEPNAKAIPNPFADRW